MESFVQPCLLDIQISGIRKIANLVASRYPDALTLTIGQPDFPTPRHILEAGKKAIEDNRTVYTPNAGLPELRQAAARFMQEKYGLSYDSNEEIITTAGASQALDITLRTVLRPGAEVILPGPIYPGYEPLIRLCGAEPVFVDTSAAGFKLTPELLEAALTERTRAIVMCYPSNPTGRILRPAELARLAEIIRDRNLLVVSDEIYSELIYDGEHASMAGVPGMRDKTVVINGLSKSHSMTGWRIGFTFAPAALSRHMLKVHQYNVTCANSIGQYAAVEALTAGRDDAEPMKQEYRKRRDFVFERLREIGLEVEKPEGALYIFPSIRHLGLPSLEFAYRLLEEERVAVVPGDAFGPFGEGFIRISYAYSMDTLTEALRRLESFVAKLKG